MTIEKAAIIPKRFDTLVQFEDIAGHSDLFSWCNNCPSRKRKPDAPH